LEEIKRLSICQNTILVVFLHGLSDVCPFVFPYWIQNKAVVFLNWVYYIRFDREGRLIIRPYKRKVLPLLRVMKCNCRKS
jgi:hypothetical protein